jgi:hypothetical protein
MHTCERGHLMVPVVDGLELCECSSRGRLAYRKGAVALAQKLVERAGGLAQLRDQLLQAEQERRQERKEQRAEQAESLRKLTRELRQP